jgi:DNA-binding winged helix-turn-helix (wHTH) protein
MVATRPDARSRVELLQWPADADRREELRRDGRPRLLLVGPDVFPPAISELEDWVRLPADERDVYVRLQRLSHLAVAEPLGPGDVVVDDHGLLSWRGGRVALPDTEAAMMRLLAEDPGRVVTRDQLMASAWPEGGRQAHSLDSRVFTLRKRLGRIGLVLDTVRNHGFRLAEADPIDPISEGAPWSR